MNKIKFLLHSMCLLLCGGVLTCVERAPVHAADQLPDLVGADAPNHALVNWERGDSSTARFDESIQQCNCAACTGEPASCDAWVGCGCESRPMQGRRCESKKCSQLYGGIEYLNWWSNERYLPALIAGGNGLPPSQTLFGGGEFGDDYQSGLRITAGYWLDQRKSSAFVFRGYGADGSEVETSLRSNGSSAFAIPFTNDGSNPLLNGQPDALALSAPGLLQPGRAATAQATASNDIVGGDLFFRQLHRRGCGYRIDWIAGYQYSGIDDDVSLSTSTNRNTPGNPTFTTLDTFDASNRFHAGALGLLVETQSGCMTLQMMGKLGLGNMNQEISIRGSNTVNGAVSGGGIFAQDQSASGGPTFNVGDYERDEFAWSPEMNVKSIICLRDNINLTLGYTFIYWSDVLLAGDHIDTRVNRDVLFDGPFIPGGGGAPSFAFNSSSYWAHSLDIGCSIRY